MEEDEIVISRIRVVQKVDLNTPLCVLEEILDAHRIGYPQGMIHEDHRRNLIEYIDGLPEIHIKRPIQSRDLRILASYVNNLETKWTQSTLMEAFETLQRFHQPERIVPAGITANFTVGRQTTIHPTKLNACVLYRLCKDFGLRTTPYTDIGTMAEAVRLYLNGPDACYEVLGNFIQNTPPTVLMDPSADIINALILKSSMFVCRRHDEELSHDILEQYIRSPNPSTSLKSLLKRIVPISSCEAIALAAKVYSKDISEAEYPITEFRVLSISQSYIPLDTNLRTINILNPDLLDLKKTFNPLFPEQYYTRSALAEMAAREGYSEEHIRSSNPYELLQLSTLLDNFYYGLYPEISNEQTPIAYDDVNELEPGMIICYGVRRQSLTAYSIEEIVDHLRIAQNFVHPLEVRTVLMPRVIQKLKVIASSEEECSERARILKRELSRIIEEIELLSDETMTQVREFREMYMESSATKQEGIRCALRKLLHVSMYMRGWRGSPYNFPIADTPVDNQHQVNIRVTIALNEFEDKCRELGHEGVAIANLPLLRHRSGEFTPIRTEAQGRTIQERLDIVKHGNATSNIHSCIRMSSNVLAASTYRYMVLIGEPAPFTISELRTIS